MYYEMQAILNEDGGTVIPMFASYVNATRDTVGYGDMYPVTGGGKFFTFLVLMVGLGVVAVPTGLIASALSQARDEEKT
jgi:voltage-gated potassium channel